MSDEVKQKVIALIDKTNADMADHVAILQKLQKLASRGLYVVTAKELAIIDAAERWHETWAHSEDELGDTGVDRDLYNAVRRWKGLV